ncbi:hypothetical protein BVC80_1835g762 [Macleaya cordata]|uniref:SAWADEE domain-containing protein n=1 Tax=Macleaya cordata TaxID=56857 RepID=A0A200R6H3_MACCD|nr:hypothetical protein BVC80_1835g762 [Macleaya cordata]
MVMAKTVADDLLELEAMRKEDSSWHPCQVSFSSDTGLIVDFGSQYSEDVLFTEEEALARLRFCSHTLQGDDCFHIKEGDHVLAIPKTQSKRLFFDAEVEKVYRVRHSKKIYCRCTFEIKWLCPKFKGGTVTVPSSSIMKMATNKIDSHPTVAAFLNFVRALNCSSVSPFVSLVEDTVCETDLPIMLEQQIEEIIRLADTPRKVCGEENLFELKRVDFEAQGQQRRTIKSQASSLHDKVLHENNNCGRSTRSQISGKNPPQPIPEAEEFTRAHLSPLGARAALASLVHELPQKPELSICHVEQEDFFNESQNTIEKHASAAFLDVTRTLDFDACIEETVSMKNDLPSTEKTHPAQVTLRQTKITKPLTFDKKTASNKSSQGKGSLEMLIIQEKPAQMLDDREDERSNIAGVKTHLTTSATDQKLNHPMEATRLTHSMVQKGNINLNNDVELKSPTEGTKLSNPTHTTRLTRSALQKEEGKLIEKLTPTEGTNLSSSTRTTRLTRSALQKEEGKSIEKSKEGLEESKPAENTWADSNKRDHVSVVTKETRTKKSCSSPESEINLPLAQEKSKKQKVSDVPPISTRKGEISANSEGRSGEKKKSSNKKSELRFSPRLRFLPRTRSQKKSPTC